VGKPINGITKPRRSFLKRAAATSLAVSSIIFMSNNTFAKGVTKSSHPSDRKLTMAKKVSLEFKVKADKVTSLMAFLDRNLANVRNFEGCSQVKVYYNPTTHQMLFDEVWESVEHHQKYLGFITENGVMAELGSFLSTEPEIKYFDIVDL